MALVITWIFFTAIFAFFGKIQEKYPLLSFFNTHSGAIAISPNTGRSISPKETNEIILDNLAQNSSTKNNDNENFEPEDAQNQYNLGKRYYSEKNHQKALYWFTKAAEQGYLGAQFTLGLIYQSGEDVPQDYKQAFRWYTKAAEQGGSEAQRFLGLMYQSGKGVPQDYKKAAYWLTKAAEQGDSVAQRNLAVMYGLGQGVPQDHNQSYVWFSISAVDGNEKSVEGRNITESYLTPAALHEAQQVAAELMQKIEHNKATKKAIAEPSNELNTEQIQQIEDIARQIALQSNANKQEILDDMTVSFNAVAVGRNVRFENVIHVKKGLTPKQIKEWLSATAREIIPNICAKNANNPAFDRGLSYTFAYNNTYNEKLGDVFIDQSTCKNMSLHEN